MQIVELKVSGVPIFIMGRKNSNPEINIIGDL
jgi:hypothetical protein